MLSTICQFCHNLHHAFWAANRGRLRLIYAPEIDQIWLHRAAWLVLLGSAGRTVGAADEQLANLAETVAKNVDRRELIISSIIGEAHAAGLFEALLTVRRLSGEAAYVRTVEKLEQVVRFWPTAAGLVNDRAARPSASFSSWQNGGFQDLSDALIKSFWNEQFTTGQLHDLVQSLDGLDL